MNHQHGNCNRLFFFIFLMAWATFARGQGVPGRPDLFQKLDGRWTMSGDVRGKPVVYALEARPALSGAFTVLHMQDVQVPPQYAADVYLGYDPATKAVIVHWMDSFGAKYSVPHGLGELGENVIQFTIPYEGGAFRDTFTFEPASGSWIFILESHQPDGSWKHFAKYKVVRNPTGRGD